MIPTFLISQLIRQHCTVAIGGDGGDELFGGYSHYDHIIAMQKRLSPLPQWARTALAASAEQLLPIGFRGRNFLRAFGMQKGKGLLPVPFFDRISRGKLLRGNVRNLGFAESQRNRGLVEGQDLVQQATRFDFYNYLPEDILVKVDRASMLNSLEVRAPFLDYHLIDFAFSKVPSSLKTTISQRKIMLKLLARRLLPPEFDLQRKQGFSIPLAIWLESPVYARYFADVLLDSNNPVFNHQFILELINGQKKGRSNSERLFNLIMFELWRKEYGATL